ncbi:MAG: hypothetical protein ACTSO4_14330 [Promethearchaeota archaeon]
MGLIKVEFRDLERLFLEGLGELNLTDPKLLESYLMDLYPRRIIKRLIYKPYLGHYIPYMDVHDPRQGSQLFAFHGNIDINLSVRRICSACFNDLDGDSIKSLPIPVSLCNECYSRVFHGYWDCLWEAYNKFELNDLEKEVCISNDFDKCDLLLPECGFVLSGDDVNPCLRNHAIGLIIQNNGRIKIIWERLENIKQLMILNGGLFGIILGVRNKILNILSLSSVLKRFSQLLERMIKEFKDKFYSDTLNFYGVEKHNSDFKILRAKKSNYLLEKKLGDYLLDWIILRYLLQDNSNLSVEYLNSYYVEAFNFIRFFIEKFNEKRNFNLEILDFLELYQFFGPLTENFVSDLEERLSLQSNSKSTHQVLVERLKSDQSVILNDLINMFDDKNELLRELDDVYFNINEVGGNFGSFIIVKTDLSEKWMIFNIQDFIGREIF